MDYVKWKWLYYDKLNYVKEYIRYRVCQMSENIIGKPYWMKNHFCAGRPLLSIVQTNKIIGEAIDKGNPYWCGRFGDTEMKMIYAYLTYMQTGNSTLRKAATNQLCNNAGFFPNDIEKSSQFAELMISVCNQIDLQGQWARYMEDYVYLTYQKHTRLSHLFHLEPWNMYLHPRSKVKPWSSKLKGKKVLVIHPFVETIEKQYNTNRENLFEKIFAAEDILPEFELKTLKAVQTAAGEVDDRFEDWFQALNWMIEECKKIDFEIAIIGCGAYGYPLAAEIKKMGKIAIHLGGATQLLFGIMGRRWEVENPEFCEKVTNEYWTRPAENEKIRNSLQIEEGCYW